MKRFYFVCLACLCLAVGCDLVLGRHAVPEKFRNKTFVGTELYLKHKQILHDSIAVYVSGRKKAFYPEENDSLTTIDIDTIFYSPGKDKIAFLVVTGNTNDKLLSKGDRNKWHFDAHCFIGSINPDGGISHIRWFEWYSFSNYSNKKEVAEDVREEYLEELNSGRGNGYRYNLEDVRFWSDEDVWK